jgi:hypothetical protein
MSEADRLHALADCWRRLAEADCRDQKRNRLIWADYLDCLARLEKTAAMMHHAAS